MVKRKTEEDYSGLMPEVAQVQNMAPPGTPKPRKVKTGRQTYGATNMPAAAKTQVDAMSNGDGINRAGGIDTSNIGMPKPVTPHQRTQLTRTTPHADDGLITSQSDPNGGISQLQYGDTTIHKNTNVDHDKYGAAIFSNTGPAGATEAGFDADIAKHGSSGRKNAYGHDMTLTDSLNRQAEELRNKRESAPVTWQEQATPGGAFQTRSMSREEYSKRGEGTDQQYYGGISAAQHQQKISNIQEQAMGILKNLPFGGKGDREKRKGMMAQAKGLMGMAGAMQVGNNAVMGQQATEAREGIRQNQWQQEYARNAMESDRNFGLDFLKANASSKPNYQKTSVPTGQRDKEGNLVLDGEGNPLSREGFFDPVTGETRYPGQGVRQKGSPAPQAGGGIDPENEREFNWSGRRTTQSVSTKADYDKLPSGTPFAAPDGSIRIKP